MKSLTDSARLQWALAFVLLAFSGGQGVGQEDLPLENVRLPIEVYEDGTVKTQVVAGRARIPDRGDIVAKAVKIEFFTPEGEMESRLIADSLRLDRRKGVATSDGKVRYERGGSVITGVGFEWHSKEQWVRILSEAKVVFRRAGIRGLGSLMKRPGEEAE